MESRGIRAWKGWNCLNARWMMGMSEKSIATSKKLVKKAQETLAENETLAQWEAREATAAAETLAKLSGRKI